MKSSQALGGAIEVYVLRENVILRKKLREWHKGWAQGK